jgi:hypothetical protein
MFSWHEVIAALTYTYMIAERLVLNAHRIELTGESVGRICAKAGKT